MNKKTDTPDFALIAVRTIACGVAMTFDDLRLMAMGTRLLGHCRAKAQEFTGIQAGEMDEFRSHARSITR